LGLNRAAVNSLMQDIIDFSEIGDFIDAPIRTYSLGMVMRLAFAVAICVDPDVLLLDEVLAVGDEAFARKCLGCIRTFRERGKTIVLVTHNADIVQTWCDAALWLHEGVMQDFGNPDQVVAAYHRYTASRSEQQNSIV
jgi:lipopolysaccharide transport system ATP-binding protein